MDELERECAVFCRYLIDAAPSPAVVEGYVAAHAPPPYGVLGTGYGRFERVLVAVARGGSAGARLADVHARVFAPGGLLRRKLVLVLALLEVDAAAFERIDTPESRSLAAVCLTMGLRALLFVLLLVVGLVVFVPARLACALPGGGS